MTDASPRRRRARAPLVLGVALMLAIGGAVFVVSRGPPGAVSQPGGDGVSAAEPGDLGDPTRSTDGAADGMGPTIEGAVVLRGPGMGAAGVVTPDEDPVDVDRRVAEAEAQRRVFDGSIGGERPPILGTRMRRRGGASGTIGIGNAPQQTGRVTDAVTGDPIAGAEIVSLLANQEDGWARRYESVTTDEDGTFRARIPFRRAEQTEYLVRAPGYRQQRAPRADAPEEWRLVPHDGPDRGTIRGSATTPDGVALAGMLLVAMKSEHGDEGDQYAWCDASGTFELPGVRPGRWRLSLEDDGIVETSVVAGGLATAKLIAARPDARPPETPGADRRIVGITDLPDGTTLRADAGPGVFWRAVVDGGSARFELPFGLWVLTIDEKNGAVHPITVREQHGARRIEFVPDRE